MNWISLKTAAICLAALTCSAVAAPIIDGGLTDPTQYAAPLYDAAESSYGEGLDIDSVRAAQDSSYAYLFLDVVGDAPLATDGDGSDYGYTTITATLFDAQGGNLLGHLKANVMGSNILCELYDTPNPFGQNLEWTADSSDVATGEGFEVRIPVDKLSFGNSAYIETRLDNNGAGNDDVLAGTVAVPEPTTMALLGTIGAGLLLRRRRR
ncbi:MAG: PEP-CTERM sorting domain-containing protein [Phycisphaerae bacterium]